VFSVAESECIFYLSTYILIIVFVFVVNIWDECESRSIEAIYHFDFSVSFTYVRIWMFEKCILLIELNLLWILLFGFNKKNRLIKNDSWRQQQQGEKARLLLLQNSCEVSSITEKYDYKLILCGTPCFKQVSFIYTHCHHNYFKFNIINSSFVLETMGAELYTLFLLFVRLGLVSKFYKRIKIWLQKIGYRRLNQTSATVDVFVNQLYISSAKIFVFDDD